MPRICLLALIGLPAAGKTQLSNWLLENQTILSDWNTLHLCYDDYLDIESTKDYKEQRNYIHQLLSQLIDTLKDTEKATKLPPKIRQAATMINNNNYLIICDDNHYYRSMRYKLYQLCRSRNCIYAQIYICRDLASCLEANEARGATIPCNIIQQMHARLEAPTDNAWECNNLTLNQLDFIAIKEFTKSLLLCQLEEPSQNWTQPKQTQLQSLSHQLDLLLRSRIKIQIQNSNSKAAESRILNEKRKQILAQFRQEINDKQTAVNDEQLQYYVNLFN
ncbi:L-seryl-tRNA(Sec) kinase [Drosophila innubila]|uniref:L-seryl-tRNA(Sec) kinase n=1 Tax=Drosophila innubila TaxID=198719 RepID=UPI00148BE275|nr:L-seryl-tRNA(Sec) kinase [Drosophila innubila]